MPSSVLPKLPLALFGVVEPVLLYAITDLPLASNVLKINHRLWAYINHLQQPHQFYASQIPNAGTLASTPFPQQAQILVYQLGNVYLLLALLALVCCWTTSRSVVRGYLAAVALADLGHIYAVYRVLGSETFWDVGQWNDMIWGSVGVSAILHVNRLATLLGVFGRVGV